MIHSFVLTGFLGVGKTTMLTNTVQKHFSEKQVAIIVNEFGDIGVDSKILTNVHSQVLEISEGCICCQLSQEFESGVIEIIEKYNPEIIFVETSGASEPFPIFLSLQNLGISVEGILCVIDSKNFSSYKENSTAKYQIGGSNILVLNKTDLVSKEELEVLEKEVRSIKEEFNIKNNLTGRAIFNGYMIQHAQQGIVNKEVFDGVYKAEEIATMAQEQEHLSHTSEDSITQKVAYIKENIRFEDLETLLESLPKNIYRVKGVVKLIDVEKPLFINYSFGDGTYQELDQEHEKSVLVFIGSSIDKDIKSLDKLFEFLMIPQFSVHK